MQRVRREHDQPTGLGRDGGVHAPPAGGVPVPSPPGRPPPRPPTSNPPRAHRRTLKRAFGWAGKAYWRQERPEPEVPTPEAVQAVQAYLVSLGLTGAEVAKVVDEFPEVLGCSVEDRLAANVAQLEKQWKMQGPAIKGVVLRRPDVLGFNLDCLGDCAGECNRCWVRF